MKQKKHISSHTKCRGCGKRMLLNSSKYCFYCAKLAKRLHNEHFRAKARKYFWAYLHKRGRRCHYSGILLEIDDDTSPWYLVFSRLDPADKAKIVPAAAFLNEMKSSLSEKEFWYYVLALDDHREKHLKVKKIPLVHWQVGSSTGDKVCAGCWRAPALKGRKFCARCARIAFRMKHDRLFRECINEIWDYVRKYGFVCYYTGMPLELDDPKSPWYLVFDHWMPRDPRKIVITSSLLNEMKSDLTEKEFWYFIRQLANFRRHGSVVRKRKLAYWCRPYR
ncbi:MAG: hypothetical protein HQL12_00570 [Candidatus Omnitrophica bacterium]|nr:hypothetical protein [Candidatus Omnitrophota bacterium]